MIDEILNDLSNSLSQPEADALLFHLREKNYTHAKTFLHKHGLSEIDIKSVIDYYKKKASERKEFIEYYSFEFNNLENGESVIVSYGGNIIKTQVIERNNEKYFFHHMDCDFILLNKAQQIWKINII